MNYLPRPDLFAFLPKLREEANFFDFFAKLIDDIDKFLILPPNLFLFNDFVEPPRFLDEPLLSIPELLLTVFSLSAFSCI